MEVDFVSLAIITVFVIANHQYFLRVGNPTLGLFKRKYVVAKGSKLFAFFKLNSRSIRLLGSVLIWFGLAGISTFRGEDDSSFWAVAVIITCLGGLTFISADFWMLYLKQRG